ncbi:hypothetical protein CHS0354_034161 [Potamilus streckersoni]|uniref:Uncharacterized protein n=1 Tax=Potamilus streckersoni TaxID=2493646 RepID=A0AAE0RMX1_9BIVA|nr:hypothetical protein CHS0354_034161 [Potamilus streckersoni]
MMQMNYGQTPRPDSGDTKFPNMVDNKVRFDSFRTWRGCREINMRNLVENGFFCSEQGDSVQCYICGIIIGTWTVAMDPFLEHVRYAPYCRLLPKLQPQELLAEIKDQIFGIDKMRVPSGIPLDKNSEAFTGHRVEYKDSSSTSPPTATVPDGQGERHLEGYGMHWEQAHFVAQTAGGEELDGVSNTNLKIPGQNEAKD